jgi:hypothetical protein
VSRQNGEYEATGCFTDGTLGTAAPGGFAALADVDGDMSDAASSEDVDTNDKAGPQTDADKANAAAVKAFFTSHKNASTSSSQKPLSFSTLPNCTLSRQLLLALGSLNLSVPTPIQAECIPLAMMGKDIVASSATGSGKTVAFWVGVLERLLHRDRRNPMTRVVVMTPTRELAVQVHGVGMALARYTDVSFCLCVGACVQRLPDFVSYLRGGQANRIALPLSAGGLSLKVQEAELKQRPDIVVSTPGRLIDHVRNTPCFTMDGVEVLVLDEADRMLEEVCLSDLSEGSLSLPGCSLGGTYTHAQFPVACNSISSGFPRRARGDHFRRAAIAPNAPVLGDRDREYPAIDATVDEQARSCQDRRDGCRCQRS